MANFRVSEIAKLAGTSRKTLIYYDKIDLIKPTRDEKTGYRYYSCHQFFQIKLVLSLREIGISIKDIRKYIESNDIDVNISFIKEYEKEVNKKMEKLSATKELLTESMEKLYKYKNTIEHTPTIKHVNHKYVVSMDVNIAHNARNEISMLFMGLPEYAKSRGVNKLNSFGAVLSKELNFQGYHRNLKSIFGVIEDPNEYSNGTIQNYGLCGSIYHKGAILNYAELPLKKLLKYIGENDYEVVGDPILIRIIDESSFTSIKNGLIEILIPVDNIKRK